MFKYLEPFIYVQTRIIILAANKLVLTHYKIRLPTNYCLTNHMYNHLIVRKQMSCVSFKNVIYKISVYKSYIYKEDLALNNQQCLICHKTQSNKTNTTSVYIRGAFNKFPDFFSYGHFY